MTKKISQRDARRYRSLANKASNDLRAIRRGWTGEWPDHGIFIGRIDNVPKEARIVETAKRLNHAVLVTVNNDSLVLWADPVQAEMEGK